LRTLQFSYEECIVYTNYVFRIKSYALNGIKSYQSTSMRLDLFVKLKYESKLYQTV